MNLYSEYAMISELCGFIGGIAGEGPEVTEGLKKFLFLLYNKYRIRIIMNIIYIYS